MRNLLRDIESLPRWLKAAVAAGLVLLIAALGRIMPDQFSLSVFYVLPVALAGWWGGLRLGYVIAVLAAVAWFQGGQWSAQLYEREWIRYWNGFSPFLLFVIVLHLVDLLHQRLEWERARAERDGLTGLLNLSTFMLQAEEEIARARRFGRPFAVAFMDLDNFKEVNDTQGHVAGNAVLRTVAATLQRVVREADVIARAGGDEFVVLLVEAEPQGAVAVVEAMRDELLRAMAELNCAVTFSIGLVVFKTPPVDTRSMVQLADKLMYDVKRSGKNAIRHAVFEAAL
ncbi:MAG: diguanylate cyclase [Gammaproteobacteria bacterium]|nr:diguanylate cyclase [Gammaproteobacteria bacterium]